MLFLGQHTSLSYVDLGTHGSAGVWQIVMDRYRISPIVIYPL